MPVPGMDRPPLPGPDIQTQMGVPQPPSQEAGLSSIKPSQGPPPPGAPNPNGFLLAQVDAIKKVLEQIATAEPLFAPFAQKALSILDTGVSAVSTAPRGPEQPGKGPTEAGTAGPAPPPSGSGGGSPPLG